VKGKSGENNLHKKKVHRGEKNFHPKYKKKGRRGRTKGKEKKSSHWVQQRTLRGKRHFVGGGGGEKKSSFLNKDSVGRGGEGRKKLESLETSLGIKNQK